MIKTEVGFSFRPATFASPLWVMAASHINMRDRLAAHAE
jgi:hypothetical protein